jgi:hypothetical protein
VIEGRSTARALVVRRRDWRVIARHNDDTGRPSTGGITTAVINKSIARGGAAA